MEPGRLANVDLNIIRHLLAGHPEYRTNPFYDKTAYVATTVSERRGGDDLVTLLLALGALQSFVPDEVEAIIVGDDPGWYDQAVAVVQDGTQVYRVSDVAAAIIHLLRPFRGE